MNIIEENKLSEIICDITNFKSKYKNFKTLYKNISSLDIKSIQELSYENDLEFFDDVSFILSVITSIISRPHISTIGEDIVIRSDLAGSISQESFQKMFREPSLWKEKDCDMVPEYVHHYQYTDELKTYENIFIGMLINLIDNNLNNQILFYSNLIPSINITTKNKLENKNVESLLDKIDNLKRKMMYIKNTYFYKEISKCDLKLKSIIPTNILVKDRLYNHCFKFYKKFIKYVEVDKLQEDLCSYYYSIIIKEFKTRNFEFDKEDDDKLWFKYEDFDVSINKSNDNYIELFIKHQSNIEAIHNLFVSINIDSNSLPDNLNADTNDTVSIWNLRNQNGEILNQDTMNPEELIRIWLDSKFIKNQVQKSLYIKYCPMCKSKSVTDDDSVFSCSSCGSKYTFIDENTIWVCKTRSI